MDNIFIVITNNGNSCAEFEDFVSGVFLTESRAKGFEICESLESGYFMVEEWSIDLGRVERMQFFLYEGFWYKSINPNLNP